MLTADQLSIAIAAVLIATAVLGWFLHWLWLRLAPGARSDAARINDMIHRLHDAEHARTAAEEEKELAENLLAAREAEMEERMAAMQARLDGAIQGREAQLSAALREAKAEAEATLSGLRNARAQIQDLEAEIADLRARQAAEET